MDNKKTLSDMDILLFGFCLLNSWNRGEVGLCRAGIKPALKVKRAIREFLDAWDDLNKALPQIIWPDDLKKKP